MTVAFEAEHRVDDVLEHPRPGEVAIFGDMADEDDRDAATLRLRHQTMRASAYLHDAAGWRAELGIGHRLDAVDDDQLWMRRCRDSAITWGNDVSANNHRFAPTVPSRSARSRTCCALSSPLTYNVRAGHVAASCKQQSALADAGFATQQRHAAGHQAAAEHSVEFGDSGRLRPARRRCRPRRSASPCALDAIERSVATVGFRAFDVFDQRVPGLARRALAGPLRMGGCTCGAAIDEAELGHDMHPREGVLHDPRAAAMGCGACAAAPPR